MLAPDTFEEDDTWVGPLLDGLEQITRQISGIGEVYKEAPEGSPSDNSVMFVLKNWPIDPNTLGKNYITWTFDIMHLFRRDNLSDDLTRARKFIKPWIQALSAVNNTELDDTPQTDGATISTDPKSGKIVTYVHGNQAYVALTHTVNILTEYNLIWD